MNKTRMVASSISTILRRTLPSTSGCNFFATSNSQILLHCEPTFSSSLEHSSSILPISGRNFPPKLQLFGGDFCSKSGDKTNSRCWNCDAPPKKTPFLFCDSCRSIQPVDDSVDYFQIFGLEKKYEIDISSLEGKYKDWQKKLHPDLVHNKSEKERDYAAEQSAKVTEAYRTLTKPLSRAMYVMRVNGINVNEEETITDPKLLMEIMELREAVEEANDSKALDQIRARIQEKSRLWSDSFVKAFESQKFDEAITCIQRMTYYERANEEITKKL